MIRTLAMTVAAWTAIATPHHATNVKHHKGCLSRRCDLRVDRAWARRHRPKFVWTPFVLCVFNHEAGEGQATLANASLATINFRYDAEGYEGAGNWVNSTWRAMGGRTAHAYEASPREQAEVFMAHANTRDWPLSVRACGG